VDILESHQWQKGSQRLRARLPFCARFVGIPVPSLKSSRISRLRIANGARFAVS